MGSLKLHQSIHAFAITHQHLAELKTIAILNEEMPEWDVVVSNKFILFSTNRGAIGDTERHTVVKQENGYHVVRIGDTYIDWAVRRHTPEATWPGVWGDKVE
jgi:hypothetical protein